MDLKLCPTCKTFVFEDMDTCYGCMYRFGSDPAREELVHREIVGSDFPENSDDPPLASIAESGKSVGADRSGCFLDEAPWPPPAENEEGPLATLLDGSPAPSGREESPAVKVMLLGDWRILLNGAESIAGTPALHITIEPAVAEAGSGNGERCAR
ncbi:hypothetical protein AALA69_04195 [Eggerthellaceae bacterium 24-137]